MLRVTDLTKTFGGLKALGGVSLHIPEKRVLGLLGMNGSGKTTLLNCINGLYEPSSGDIQLQGTSLLGLPTHKIAARGVGRTFQVPKLFPRMTLLENLAAPFTTGDASDAEVYERSAEWLNRVELYRLRHNYAEELSGGQQKLVELARMMVAQPKLVLLDEPFAGVNPSLALLIIRLIEAMPERDGCSVLLVSHDLTSVYQLSHNIVVLHEGRVLAEGGAAEIRSNPDVIEAYLGA
ncbi:ABC transporter ATP-binding protein [Marinimicrococcus flavescens]|uniref:ABC transporter ATP-binding protein n=1 Tax=Marinimicrococcus flavescens TaxID=3031815 RepID=A0AAP3UYD7_9PROT|nr:ABC transporter ATP-binding protein [Marinimicrococcus flavescens]